MNIAMSFANDFDPICGANFEIRIDVIRKQISYRPTQHFSSDNKIW